MTCIIGERTDGSTTCLIHGDACANAKAAAPKEDLNPQKSLDVY